MLMHSDPKRSKQPEKAEPPEPGGGTAVTPAAAHVDHANMLSRLTPSLASLASAMSGNVRYW